VNWLVARKIWDGCAARRIVGFMSLMALSPYLSAVWLPLIVLTGLHTFQDFLKVYSGPRLNIHPFYPYMADQCLHYLTIFGIQAWAGGRLPPMPPGSRSCGPGRRWWRRRLSPGGRTTDMIGMPAGALSAVERTPCWRWRQWAFARGPAVHVHA
jgi:hypothetical protein